MKSYRALVMGALALLAVACGSKGGGGGGGGDGTGGAAAGAAGSPTGAGAADNTGGSAGASGSVAPAAEPSGVTLRLDALFYADGDEATVTLDFGPFTPETDAPWVSFAVPDSGDVELVELEAQTDGTFRSARPLPLARGTSGAAYDDTLTVPAGSQLVALYFVDRSDPALAEVSEDLLADTALLEATPATPVSAMVEPDLAMTDDESNPVAGAKPVGTLLAQGGLPVQLATSELILYARDEAERDRFLDYSGGTLLAEQSELNASGADAGYTAYLVEVDPTTADLDHLPLLRALYQETDPILASRSEVLGLLTLALEAQLEGFVVSVNPRLQAFAAPAISPTEQANVTYSMQLGPAGCTPGDATNPCVYSAPALWAYLALVDRDTARVNVGVLDMGFAPNDDFRRPTSGTLVECDYTVHPPRCAPGAATAPPTVGASFVGGRVYHGTGVVTTLGGVVNDGFGAAGVAGQIAVPMLYQFDTRSYVFELGAGMRHATDDGASCINVSAGYPCRVLTNVGPDFDICSPAGRTGVCLVVTATVHAAAALVCATTAPIPIAGPIACGVALGAAAATTTACVAQLALGDVRGPMYSGVQYAARAGVPVVVSAGNPIPAESLPAVIRDYVNLDEHRTEHWGMIPAMVPEAIVAGAVAEDTTNLMFFGDRVDLWAPISSGYLAPEDPADLTSPLTSQTIGGSSAAAPYIAGVVAAMQAVNPDLDPRSSGMTELRRRGLVGTIKRLLLADANSFTDAELVALGFPSDAVERRRLVDPLGAVLAAAGTRYPDLAALGYDTSLGFSEVGDPDDTPATARTLAVGATATGTILALPSSGAASPAEDPDYYTFTTPSSPARPHETTLTFTHAASLGTLSLSGTNLMVVSRAGASDESTTTYRSLAAAGTAVSLAVVGTAGQDSVYKLSRTASTPAVPSLRITSPTEGSSVCADQPFVARAQATYPGFTGFTVPSSAYAWVDGTTGLGAGANLSMTLAAGDHTLGVSAYGAMDSVSITAALCSSTPPVAVITSPTTDLLGGSAIHLDFTDDTNGMPYAELTLQGTASDAEDGSVAGAGLAWYTDRTDLQPALLGTGASVTVRLYAAPAGCPGEEHVVTLVATDSSGTASVAVTRRVQVFLLC